MIIEFNYKGTMVHLHTITTCTEGMIKDMCPCLLLAAICSLFYWLCVFPL